MQAIATVGQVEQVPPAAAAMSNPVPLALRPVVGIRGFENTHVSPTQIHAINGIHPSLNRKPALAPGKLLVLFQALQ